MKTIPFLPCIVLIVLFCGCKKEKQDSPVRSIRFSSNALDYVNLQQGKYFIYKDSATGLADSVIVTTSQLESIFVPEYSGNWIIVPAHNKERFTLRLDAKTTAGLSSLWFTGTAETYDNFPFITSDTAYLSLTGGESNIMSEVFFLFHSQNSTASMIVEGMTYNNVVTNVNDNGLPAGNTGYRKTVYHWAKGTGVIKRTIIIAGSVKTQTLLRHN